MKPDEKTLNEGFVKANVTLKLQHWIALDWKGEPNKMEGVYIMHGGASQNDGDGGWLF